MYIEMMTGKIHRATVTDANLNYMGSITIDSTLIKAAGMLPNQKVQVVNNNNGTRLETYIIEGKADSGIICLNGAAARCAQKGDIIIVIAYGIMESTEAKKLEPKVVFVDRQNRICGVGEEPLPD